MRLPRLLPRESERRRPNGSRSLLRKPSQKLKRNLPKFLTPSRSPKSPYPTPKRTSGLVWAMVRHAPATTSVRAGHVREKAAATKTRGRACHRCACVCATFAPSVAATEKPSCVEATAQASASPPEVHVTAILPHPNSHLDKRPAMISWVEGREGLRLRVAERALPRQGHRDRSCCS